MNASRLLREPLVHFLIAGALIFVLSGLLSGGDAEREEILIGSGQIEAMAEIFRRTWQRPPTEAELEGLIEERVREEVYAREAIAMGLDRDDTIIRRRLRQKLEFVSEDLVALEDPDEDELRAWFEVHREEFREETRFGFDHVYLSADRRGARLAADAQELLDELRESEGDAFASAGDPLPLAPSYRDLERGGVARLFGTEFVEGLEELPIGSFEGPVASGYGLHLVRLVSRVPAPEPTLEDARPAVLREWRSERRKTQSDAFYEALRSRYQITIER